MKKWISPTITAIFIPKTTDKIAITAIAIISQKLENSPFFLGKMSIRFDDCEQANIFDIMYQIKVQPPPIWMAIPFQQTKYFMV